MLTTSSAAQTAAVEPAHRAPQYRPAGNDWVGGVVSGGLGPGDTRLFRDRDVLTSGAVGVRLPAVHGVPIVSQGCRSSQCCGSL